MNWRFWQTMRRLRDAVHEAEERWRKEHKRAELLREANAGLTEQIIHTRAQLDAAGVLRGLKRHPVPKPELLETLKGVTEETDWWRALHAALNERERITAAAVAEPGISSEERHFRCGRLSEIQSAREEWLGWYAEVRKPEGN